ncbi:MAG: MBL fold metallo-hydrolase [Bacteroidota bacterium]|nr:MBL fold metallo-hydrolase [Bacteroidota bacterium]
MKVTFWGAARTVTGSKHLLTLDNGKNILLDCGLFQGEGDQNMNLNSHWGFDPNSIDYVILSHAHIDHSGLLPKLVKDGFEGNIYATAGTIALCNIMLLDSARIQESDLKHVNERRKKRHEKPIEPLYDEEDAKKTLSLMKPLPLNRAFQIDEDIHVTTLENGHILGSVSVILKIKENDSKISLTFTGDIGRKDDAILNHPIPIPQSSYIICESTYGNRLHAKQDDVEAKLMEIVHQTCVLRKGKIIIPAFSIDRTQEIIYALDRLSSAGKLPSIDVYVDSPLSVKATRTMAKHKEYFNSNILDYITKDGDPFCFPNLHYVEGVEESKKINTMKKPCIIISASGMAEAGRIKHHIANNIENENNTILIVGYATPGSLAGRLKNGSTEVRIFGTIYNVKAQIATMENFSAHGDYIEMIDYLKLQDPDKVRKIFLVHGEYETQKSFAEKLVDKGYLNIEIPNKGETFTLN